MTILRQLEEIRSHTGTARTRGIPDDMLATLAGSDEDLVAAVALAHDLHMGLRDSQPDLLAMSEADLAVLVQKGFVNFYKAETLNPYVALAAKGPWVVTTHGAVVHDNGGYGMLGQGHNPDAVMAAMSRPQVMANVMTPNLSQLAFDVAMRNELGHTRPEGCPFDRFICLNSGSESMSVAMRLADVNARRQTALGARHNGKVIKSLAIEGGFHGRTSRPARISDSCRVTYEKHLASFVQHDDLVVVPQNDLVALQAAFDEADAKDWFYEAIYMEPVQGEGAPGRAVTRAFYDKAVELTHGMGGLVVVDSIQAGIRAQGVLSIVDYPGFQDCVCPDVETWSKALNAGQYPLSVLGLSVCAAELYVKGVYGNTMTTNPRALDVACTVLGAMTPALRQNILRQGKRFVSELEKLATRYPGIITHVEGTGLLFCAELDPSIPVIGFGGPEERCRIAGLGVIHGGVNALRFTPHFAITDREIDLVVSLLCEVFDEVQASLAAK